METKTLLLVSAVALLAGPALMFPAPNLNHIIDLIDKANTTLNESTYVEKVASGGCKDEFFCKVHHVLKKDAGFRANEDGEKIVRNLESSVSGGKFNCSALPENATVVTQVKMGELLKTLKHCIQKRNWSAKPKKNV